MYFTLIFATATSISAIYQVTFPPASEYVLSSFELLNLDLGGMGLPLACFGLHRIGNRLWYSIVAPFAIIALTLALFVLKGPPPRRAGEPTPSRFTDAIPVILYVSFFVSPAVSSQAFRAFNCDCFHLNATHGKASDPPAPRAPRSLLALPHLA